MYSYGNYQNDTGPNRDQNSSASWDSDSGTYHYSYVRQPAPPAPQPPRKKKGAAAKVAALVLCCALVGGGAGFGGSALYGALNARSGSTGAQTDQADPSGPEGQGGATIYRDETDPQPVSVRPADGLTPMTLAEINAAYADACVCVNVKAIVQQGSYRYEASGAGSGFIISEDGYIVTNYHVIDGAVTIKVTLNDGQTYDATLIGGEELNDVAVLKIDGVSGLKTVVLGDSDDLVVGEQVCTIGNALGTLSFSLTSGAVSATGRSVTMSDGTVMNMIQTDCTINSGNSGGPLFDSYGRVAGITSAKYSNNGQSSQASIEGIGFAIPINDVLGIITDFIEHGYVTGRPYLGILDPTDVTEQYIQVFGWPAGVYVNGVEDGSCAQKAGIKQGDIITRLGDTEITGVNQMISVKNTYRAGDTAEIVLYRSGEYFTVTITFDEQKSTDSQPSQGQQGSGYGDYGYGYGYYDPWRDFFDW